MPSALGEMLSRQTAEPVSTSHKCQVEIFFLNSVRDRAEFNHYRKRFGRDIIQFFFLNDCAVQACRHFNVAITSLGTVDELPQNAGVALKHLFATGAAAPAGVGGQAGNPGPDCGPMAATN